MAGLTVSGGYLTFTMPVIGDNDEDSAGTPPPYGIHQMAYQTCNLARTPMKHIRSPEGWTIKSDGQRAQ